MATSEGLEPSSSVQHINDRAFADMADKVLSITELSEGVLLALPMKDLLFAQKVCKHWKDVIDNSDMIQKALFFKHGVAADAAADATIRTGSWRGRGGQPTPVLPHAQFHQAQRESWAEPDNVFSFHGRALHYEFYDRNYISSCQRMYVTQPPVRIDVTYTALDRPDGDWSEWPSSGDSVHMRSFECFRTVVENIQECAGWDCCSEVPCALAYVPDWDKAS
ncbi:hypothetical protein LTR85_012102 [Meristemomyces frigidus]|nr:hypothetical protein LTR85_012102 [Meristemomyces frigidus]